MAKKTTVQPSKLKTVRFRRGDPPKPAAIKGYRDLDAVEVMAINGIKDHGELLRLALDQAAKVERYDQRWLGIARTHFQQGLMAFTRAVARPTTF